MKDLYQLSDLENRSTLDDGADKPARLAVIGHPVAHSASPQMHQAALDAADINIRYIKVDVAPGDIAVALDRMQELDFVGCNVTVPHKREALEYCDNLSADAESLRTVNTVIFGDEVIGHNTDAPGFVHAIREEFGIDLRDLRIMILGAGGGAGQAVAIQCARSGCEQIVLVNRTLEKIDALKKQLVTITSGDERVAGPGDRISSLAMDSPLLRETTSHVDLIINATSLGLKNVDRLPISDAAIEPHHLVYDMIYNPPLTPLLKQAQATGARIGNGYSMLLHQGALAFETWFPEAIDPLPHMRRGIRQG